MPRLREVELVGVQLRRGAMAAMPASVERLRIKNCRIKQSTFQSIQTNQPAHQAPPRLAELDFSDSTELTSLELINTTAAWPHLTTIKLNGCVNLFAPLQLLGEHLSRLEVIEANGVPGTEWGIVSICDKFARTLRRLSVARCPLLTPDVLLIADELTNLTSLDISGCHDLTQPAFFMLASLWPTLRFLNISETNVDNDTVDRLRLCLPECEIVR